MGSLGTFVFLTTKSAMHHFFSHVFLPLFRFVPVLESMYLFENFITGTIPTSLSQLSDMTIFNVMDTDLSGTMPPGLCFVLELRSDCVEEMSCNCCSSCCIDGGGCAANTPAPTPLPTLAPQATAPPESSSTGSPVVPSTNEPTASPTSDATDDVSSFTTSSPTSSSSEGDPSCSASISTDRTCYQDGDDIIITFENCNSNDVDWIGIYPTTTDVSNLGEPLAWLWACGDQFCSTAVDSGEAIFYNARGTGTFRVYLLRSGDSNQGPFLAYGLGNTFEMAATTCA
jgi:hypothetical protein